MSYQADTLGVGENSTPFIVVGSCDLWVFNLTSGTVKFQVAFPEDRSTWYDHPDGAFTADTSKTIFISEDKVQGRFLGVSNNADVYVRVGRTLNG